MSRRSNVIDDWSPDPWDDADGLVEVAYERARPSRSVPKVLGFGLLTVAVVAMLMVGGFGFWVIRQVNPTGDPGDKVNFTVNKGDDVDAISTRLERAGIITNAKVFRGYVARKGGLKDLQPGYYTVRPRDSMGNILGTLRTPPALTFEKVTFPEGFTVEAVAKRLSSKVPRLNSTTFQQVASAGKVRSRFEPDDVTSLEGLLFPDTYQVAGNENEEAVAKRMIDRMERVATQQGIEKPPFGGFTPYQILIIASIIEREARVDEDRGKIARVIYNRLGNKMPLEIDATLLYRADPSTPFAQLRDIDTPYNTYMHEGLPPTPIANPGAASIKAALNPTPNPPSSQCTGKDDPCEYLYYVLKDPDHHVFATNKEDHDANVTAARKAGLIP
jgi:UPF0755 protein